MMIKINEIHTVKIEKVSDSVYNVSFYENMGGRDVQLGQTEMVCKETVEEEYGVEL